MTTYGLGYIPDVADDRDKPLGARLAPKALPLRASCWSPTVRIKNQGASSSCVGQAWAYASQLGRLAKGHACPELSARAIYRLCLTLDGSSADHGTYLRSGARVVQKLGAPTEASWPFDARHVLDPLTLAAVHSGHDRHGIRGYYRIASGDTDGVRLALASGFPVVAGWQVGGAFMRYDGTGMVDVERDGLVGGHALCLYGYDGDPFLGVNSWGTSWGKGGHFVATERWVAEARDVWAVDVGDGT